MKFFDDCESHIQAWKAMSENKDKPFEGEHNFALISLPASVQIQSNDILLEFMAEFFICDIVEEMILGNPFLKETGTIYLCLEGSATNPFSLQPQIHHLEELIGDVEGECEDNASQEGMFKLFDCKTCPRKISIYC